MKPYKAMCQQCGEIVQRRLDPACGWRPYRVLMDRRRLLALVVGTPLTWPLAAQTQRPETPVSGFVSTRSAADSAPLVGAFRQGLSDYIEGSDVAIEFRWAGGQYERLPALVASLLKQHIAVPVTVGGEPSALAAKAATSTVPTVFIVGGDPVKLGLVHSYNRPGGNATGFSVLTPMIEAKRLGMLDDLVPNAAVFGVLLNPKIAPFANQARELPEEARTIKQRVEPLYASTDAELQLAPAALTQNRVHGLLVTADPFFDTSQDSVIASVA